MKSMKTPGMMLPGIILLVLVLALLGGCDRSSNSTPQPPSPLPTTPVLTLSPLVPTSTQTNTPFPTATKIWPTVTPTPISPVGGGVPTMAPFVPPRPISSGQVIFSIEDPNNPDYSSIAVINTDGGGLKTLLDSSGKKHTSPTWSPDGQHIVFSSNRDGPVNLYVMNADGSGVRRLTEGVVNDDHPDWSPNENDQRIAFSSQRNGARNIYTINADGSNVQQLTSTSSPDRYPVWSPDGKSIAFEELLSGRGEIFVMNADGTGVRNISQHQNARDTTPSWSPDSSSIAFSSDRENSDFDIYVVKVSGLFRLTTTTGLDTAPSWSPDGSGIVFVSRRDGSGGLYVMSADGTYQTMLLRGEISSPDWQP